MSGDRTAEELWASAQRLPADELAVVVALVDALADGDDDAIDRVQAMASGVGDRCGAIVREALSEMRGRS